MIKVRGVIDGNPPPRRANLISGLGKCLSLHLDSSKEYYWLVNSGCDPKEKGQLWSWNETSLMSSSNRHLCNGHGKCACMQIYTLLTKKSAKRIGKIMISKNLTSLIRESVLYFTWSRVTSENVSQFTRTRIKA